MKLIHLIKKNALRDVAAAEILFSTGIRISELCSLKPQDINLSTGTILIYGKGDKERRITIGNNQVLQILNQYKKTYHSEINICHHFLQINPVNHLMTRLFAV